MQVTPPSQPRLNANDASEKSREGDGGRDGGGVQQSKQPPTTTDSQYPVTRTPPPPPPVPRKPSSLSSSPLASVSDSRGMSRSSTLQALRVSPKPVPSTLAHSLYPPSLPPISMREYASTSHGQMMPPPTLPKPVPNFAHHNMNSPLSPKLQPFPYNRTNGHEDMYDLDSEVTLDEDEDPNADPDSIQAHTLLHTQQLTSQQQMNLSVTLNSNASYRSSHPNAPARILNDPRMGRVRRNWIQHVWGNFGAISRSSRVLLIVASLVMISEIVITTFVLLISHSTGEVCNTSLDIYLIVYEIRVIMSLPLVVYQYLHPPLEQAYGRPRTDPTIIERHPNRGPSPTVTTSTTSTAVERRIEPGNNAQETSTRRPSASNLQPVGTFSASHRRRNPLQPPPGIYVNKELNLLVDRLKTMLDIFSVIWFIVGNWWIFTSIGCYRTAPLVYYLSVAFLAMGYVVVSIPIVMCLGIVFCLPCVLIFTRILRIGGANPSAGTSVSPSTLNPGQSTVSDEISKLNNQLGLPDDVIKGIPVLTFRAKAKRASGMEKKRSSGYSDPQLLLALPVTGGVTVGMADSVSGMESRKRVGTPGGLGSPQQANVIVDVSQARNRMAALAAEQGELAIALSRSNTLTQSQQDLGDLPAGPRLPPKPRPPSVSSSHTFRCIISTAAARHSGGTAISSFEACHDVTSSAPTSPIVPPRPKLSTTNESSPTRNPASPSPPPPPVLRRPAPHTLMHALEKLDGNVDTALTDEDAVCVICLHQYEDGDRVRKLVCDHHFHVQCVDEWLRCNKTCPLCCQLVTAESVIHV
ncbi:hypothetical protein BC830DRAFT_80950 [Chytriomyces sp. MP71]|nr:hypothetical protein BC830DRAFT_80950 [Chytriomyces sp. MP71]